MPKFIEERIKNKPETWEGRRTFILDTAQNDGYKLFLRASVRQACNIADYIVLCMNNFVFESFSFIYFSCPPG